LCGGCGADNTYVFLSIVAKTSDLYLEQGINIKVHVKLGKNASDACAMLTKATGGQAMETSSGISG